MGPQYDYTGDMVLGSSVRKEVREETRRVINLRESQGYKHLYADHTETCVYLLFRKEV